jgi:hypothetical protein
MRSKATCTAETFTGELIAFLIAQLDLSVSVLRGGREGRPYDLAGARQRCPRSTRAFSFRSDALASLAGRPPTSAWPAKAPSGPSGALNSLR